MRKIKSYKAFNLFLSLNFLTANVFANSLETTAVFYNKSRKQPQIIFDVISQSRVDRKFVSMTFKGVNELPPLVYRKGKLFFTSEGKSHRFEILDKKKNVFMMDGTSITDRPAGMLQDRYSAIELAIQKSNAHLMDLFLPKAHAFGPVAAAVWLAILGLGGVTEYHTQKRNSAEGVCDWAQFYFTHTKEEMEAGFKEKLIPRLEQSAESERNERLEFLTASFKTFNEECDSKNDGDSNHQEHCKDLGEKYSCAADFLESFFKAADESQAKAASEGKSIGKWKRMRNLGALRVAVKDFRALYAQGSPIGAELKSLDKDPAHD